MLRLTWYGMTILLLITSLPIEAVSMISKTKGIEFKVEEGRKIVGVIDAGSSGSRFYILEYLENPSLGQNRVIEVTNFKSDPGISTFGDKLNEISPHLNNLLEGTKKKLEAYNAANKTKLSLEKLPVYLLATAGMRNISSMDRENILSNIRDSLSKTELDFKDAQTIEGLDEAIYAWTAANFNQPVKEPRGIVEVGGASTQVVFPFSGTNPNKVSLTIDGKVYDLYAYSYPKHGENESVDLLKRLALGDQSVCATKVDAPRTKSTFNQCVNYIVDGFKSQCDDKSLCKFGWTPEATQPPVDPKTPFTFAGMIRASKNDFVDTKNQKILLEKNSLKKAGTFACQMTTKDIAETKAVKELKFASQSCFQLSLSYAILYGNIGVGTGKKHYKGVGLSTQMSLIDSPAPGPAWPLGFVLFHQANGSINESK